MSRKLGVAGLQLKKDPDNPSAIFESFERTVRNTKALFAWVDLVFTGELFLQPFGKKDWKDLAINIPGELTDKLSNLAKEVECWLVPGTFLEIDGPDIYNTAIAFNPKGEIVAKYRKMYPWMPFEDTTSGTDFVIFEIPGITKVGLVICYDLWFPELFRTLTWMGAEVILLPSATYTPDRDAEIILTQAQAIIHQCYVLNTNVISRIGGGRSLFTDPEGRVLQAVGTHEEVMTEIIDLDRVAWIRQNGSYGISQVWKSFRDSPLGGRFPQYEKLHEGEIFKDLGELKFKKSIREWI
ncbi:MAG TPA: carbon-nitrogen hydrolase family protein [bacterium]|nr:carbon-nitrogen hydrolase family protein [bacterium]